jgi:iron complex outermembrane receptor protein
MRYGKVVLLLSAALGAGISMPSFAQEGGSDEIVVTARRVEERLQDVPISITVFNQGQLTDRGVTNATDLATYTPSLQAATSYGSNNASFSIRGFVQDTFTAPSVGVYFADVIAPRGASSITSGDGAGPGSFFDLQNVQVLKGPQGTLFGRNTTGGAVLLVPQRPKGEFGGYVEASLGNFGLQKFQGVLNVPLSDHIRLRAGVDKMKRDGYLDNIGIYGPKHFSDTDYIAGRLSLLIDVTPDIENYTIATYSRSSNNSSVPKITDCNPAAVIAAAGQVLPGGAYSCAQVARIKASGNFYAVENAISDPNNKFRQWQVINTTNWDVSDSFSVKNIISYAELKNTSRFSVFGNYWVIDQNAPTPTNTVRPGFLGQVITPAQATVAPDVPFNNQNTLTEEFQIRGKAFDGKLNWQAGLYYELSKPVDGVTGGMGQNNGLCENIGFNAATGLPDASTCVLPYSFLSGLSREVRTSKYTDKAIYAQGTFAVSDKVSVTAGLRYTDDVSNGLIQAFQYTFLNGDPLPPAFGGPVSCNIPGVTLAGNCSATVRQHSNALTGLIDVEFRPNNNMMIYAKYSRGYRQGIVNPRGVPPYNKFGQEKVDAYETGLKTSWNGSTPGSLNFAAFYNDFTNQQLNISFEDARGNTKGTACACGTSRIYGAEIDGSISLFESFRLSAAAAYLNTKLTAFDAPTLPVGYIRVIAGNEVGSQLSQSPKFKGNVTASYTVPMSEDMGEVTLSGTIAHTGDYFIKSTERSRVNGFTTVNLNATWANVAGSPVDFAVFVTNVTKEKYYTYVQDLYDTGLGFVASIPGEPRMLGARVRYHFGADAN